MLSYSSETPESGKVSFILFFQIRSAPGQGFRDYFLVFCLLPGFKIAVGVDSGSRPVLRTPGWSGALTGASARFQQKEFGMHEKTVKLAFTVAVLCVTCSLPGAGRLEAAELFYRGDADLNGDVDLSDAIYILSLIHI